MDAYDPHYDPYDEPGALLGVQGHPERPRWQGEPPDPNEAVEEED